MLTAVLGAALLGGKVFTADSVHPWAEAVAIRGERIVAGGTTAEVCRWVGAQTKIYELGGRVVVPGFNDAHRHISAPPEGAWMQLGGEGFLPDPPLAQVLDSLAAAAARAPRGTWLRGGVGESVINSATSLRDALDRVAPDHPEWYGQLDLPADTIRGSNPVADPTFNRQGLL